MKTLPALPDRITLYCQSCGSSLTMARPIVPCQGECPACRSGFVLNPADLPLPLPRDATRGVSLSAAGNAPAIPVSQQAEHANQTNWGWLFTFKGRVNRSQYAHWVVMHAGLGLLGILLGVALMQVLPAIGGLGLLVWIVALTWSSIALTARRMHDTGESGNALWILLIVPLVPIAYPIMTVIGLIQPGQDKPNRYGPIPHPGNPLRARGVPG